MEQLKVETTKTGSDWPDRIGINRRGRASNRKVPAAETLEIQ
jgi:hypothetical protein